MVGKFLREHRYFRWLFRSGDVAWKPPFRARLLFEALEDRFAPAVLYYIGPAGGNWSTGANWDGGVAPVNDDSVVFATNARDSTNDIANLRLTDLTLISTFTSTVTLNQSLTVTGTLTIANGKLTGAADVLTIRDSTSIFDWSGGEIEMRIDIGSMTASPTVRIFGNADKTLTVRDIYSYGNTTWTGGDIKMVSQAAIRNAGTFDIQVDKTIERVEGTPRFINVSGGILKKTGGGGTTTIKTIFTNDGIVQFNSGTVHFTSESVAQHAGSMTLNGGTFRTDNAFHIFGGLLDGVGTITGDINNIGGTVHPGIGSNPGVLNIVGNYSNGEGTLVIDINAAGTHGQLRVQLTAGGGGGVADLSGTLRINRDAAYQPTSGSFEILTYAGGYGGDFATVDIPNNAWMVGGVSYAFSTIADSFVYYLDVSQT